MKAKILGVGLVIVLITALVIQHVQIAASRDRIMALEELLAQAEAAGGTQGSSRQMGAPSTEHSIRPKSGDRPSDTPGTPTETGDDTLGNSLRQMSENPAGRAMMNQGIKAMSAMWFADLVDEFGLTREEENYFLRLVAGSMSTQQNVGMKMMTAETDEEREALKEEIETVKKETKKAIKNFLNNDEDFAAYEHYEEQLPERQQLEGLRNTMLEAGAPLTPEQEDQVIEAMYKVRTTAPQSTDWHGSGGMEAIASGDATKKFEEEWERSSTVTAEEVGKILEGPQLEAFKNYQVQMKDMQIMGIKMAEKMFEPKKDAPAEE